MRRIFLTLFLIPLVTIILGAAIFVKYAYAENSEVVNVTISKNEVINHDYFAGGNTVNISGTINGDAYIAGGNVTFDGVVNGDLLAAGGNVTILGKVTGNVRTAGGNVIFSSNVGRNATILGGSISMSQTGAVKGSLATAGGSISINSPVEKEINAAAGQITLGNKVNGPVNTYASNLNLTSDAVIIGDLNYWSEKELPINPEASVSGKVKYHYVQTPRYDEKKTAEAADSGKILGLVTAGTLMFYVYSLIVTLVTGLLLIKLLPVFTAETVATIGARPWASLGVGFLTIVLFPITFVVLLITVVGIPLALALLTALIVLWFISETFVALFIGTKVLNYFRNEESSKGWSLLTGLIILGLLSLIPVINFFAGMLTYVFGAGALLIQKKKSYSLLRQKKLI